ncbi:hypothetical protein ACFLQ2_03510 [archaeon]
MKRFRSKGGFFLMLTGAVALLSGSQLLIGNLIQVEDMLQAFGGLFVFMFGVMLFYYGSILLGGEE